MVVTFSKITFDMSGLNPHNTTPDYYENDLNKLIADGADGGVQADLIYNDNGTNVSTVGIIGTQNGIVMMQPTNKVALPCPPYCNSDGGATTQTPITYLSTH